MNRIFTLGGVLLLLFLGACQGGSETSGEPKAPKAFTAQEAAKRNGSEENGKSLSPDPIIGDGYTSIDWDDLAKVKFEEKYYEEVDANLLFPTFSEDVKALEGQKLTIKGYVIPLSPGRYVLSANPFASCFFCGNAGPESVLELYLEDTSAIYFSDEFVRFGGVFQLNDSDIDHLNYIFKEAVPVKD